MSQFTMMVGGDALTTSGSFGVVNPASGDVYAEAPECSRSELDAAMDASAKAYLSGSVLTADCERSATIAGQLECGTAWVNAHLALAPHQSFGGTKWSGLGVEIGPWGFFEFTDIQVLHRAKGRPDCQQPTSGAA
jgi:acyl-CoA reductase-like NAD-dependent aldehyde dehydrogenase